MLLKLYRPREPLCTVSTWVRLYTGVDTNMTLQHFACLEQLSAVTTVVWSSVAVHMTFMVLQVIGLPEATVTHRTPVRLISRVHSHVAIETSSLTKRPVTHATLVRSLSTVSSAVLNEVVWLGESFAAHSAFKRSLSRVTSSVHCQVVATATAFAALGAHVLTCMNIHVVVQVVPTWKSFLALTAQIQVFFNVKFFVNIQRSFPSKSFTACCTEIWPLPVITQTINDVSTVSFSHYSAWILTCTSNMHKTSVCQLTYQFPR